MTAETARYPYETPIAAYGNGGFRFADMSHKGSILCLPTGIFAWPPARAEDISTADFARVFADLRRGSVLLLGTGAKQVFPDAALTRAFAEAGIGLEPMSTGAAARTYNILLGEQRSNRCSAHSRGMKKNPRSK